MKTEFEKKVKEVKEVEEKMQNEISALKKANSHSSHLIFLQFGDTSYSAGDYANAILYYIYSLCIALQCDSTYNVEFVLNKLDFMIDKYAEIEQDTLGYQAEGYLYRFSEKNIKNIENYNNTITSSHGFNYIHEKYLNTWNHIQKIIGKYRY